jgi:hypothetical protein
MIHTDGRPTVANERAPFPEKKDSPKRKLLSTAELLAKREQQLAQRTERAVPSAYVVPDELTKLFLKHDRVH